MRKLLGAILSSAVCVVLSFSTTGCTPKPKEGKKEFALAAKNDEEIEKKDGAVANLKTEHGEVIEASVEPKDKGVTAEKDGKSMVKVKVGKASEVTEKKYTIKIKGKGTDDKEKTLEYTLKVKEPTKPSETKKEAATLAEADLKLDKKDGAMVTIKVKHGTITDSSIDPKKGVKLDKDGDSAVKITVDKAADLEAKYKVMIKAKGDDGAAKELTATLEVVEPKKKPDDKKPDDKKPDDKKPDDKKPDDKNVEKFSASEKAVSLKTKDITAEVKFTNGKIKEVAPAKSDIINAEIGKDMDKITFKALKENAAEKQEVVFTITPVSGAPVMITVTIPKK